MDAVCRVAVISGETTIVQVAGELSHTEIAAVEARLEPILARAGLRRLVLDIGELTFIDSVGIALVLRLKRRSIEDGFTFTVAGLCGVVRSRLDRAGVLGLVIDKDRRARLTRRHEPTEADGRGAGIASRRSR